MGKVINIAESDTVRQKVIQLRKELYEVTDDYLEAVISASAHSLHGVNVEVMRLEVEVLEARNRLEQFIKRFNIDEPVE